jgi:hypothetical protein
MKLFFCPRCGDIVKMLYKNRSCACGLCSGHYNPDGHTAVIVNGIGIGVSNRSFFSALYKRPEHEVDAKTRNQVNTFEAWVTPLNQPRIQQKNTEENPCGGSIHLENVKISKGEIVQTGQTICGINFWEDKDIHWSIWYSPTLYRNGAIEPSIHEIAKRNNNVCKMCQKMSRRLRNPMKLGATVHFRNF